MGRKWMWFILVVSCLLFISLEAASANGKGGDQGSSAKGAGGPAGGKGTDAPAQTGGSDTGGSIGTGAQGKGNGDQNGFGQGNGNGQEKGVGNGKGQGDENGNGGNGFGLGKGNDNGKGDGKGNQGGDGKGNENGNQGENGNDNGNNKGKGNDNGNQGGKVERTGQEQAVCTAENACFHKQLTCPAECPHRRPGNNNMKGCYIDCSTKCEATCKWRKPNCDNHGSLCYDPRFVGGDGNMFYFHGFKGTNFAIVTDDNLQINAHFIGHRPKDKKRDLTWVQALSIMFDTHTLILAAKKVSKWDDKVDSLIVKWDGQIINIPTDGQSEWRNNTGNRVVVIERTDDFNTIRARVSGLLQVDTRVVPIGEQENKVHNYQIPANDAFAHLETQFKFFKLSDSVEGVLGKTYQPGFESKVKMGDAMPVMGGEDKYHTPSLTSPLCKLCKFQRPSSSNLIAMVTEI
ncbi:OLC1v1003967C1 [Oldenlandia corymbosa var. corymbosa]|uniref:OLC1v1003967C1 n=1 Tax=Oldenlandia corymbosa var. corymbosa TaxID=529605 RepID=A0AAV1DB55_OLDCO|nr:OLC1v1003967C1 [Oldenlandia corymbosa var. corymbosa]